MASFLTECFGKRTALKVRASAPILLVVNHIQDGDRMGT